MKRRAKIVIALFKRLVALPFNYVNKKLIRKVGRTDCDEFPLIFVVAAKDFHVLRDTVDLIDTTGWRTSVSEIFLFVPKKDFDDAIIKFPDCKVVIEDVLGVAKFKFSESKHVSANWLYQQALKLSLDCYFEDSQDVLILDGDTFIDLSLFARRSGYTFRYAYENYEGYKLTCMELGYSRQERSYISHHSFFNTSVLKEIRSLLVGYSGGSFEDGIVALANKHNGFFSEYELIFCEMSKVYDVKVAPFFLDNWGISGTWAVKSGWLDALSRHSYR